MTPEDCREVANILDNQEPHKYNDICNEAAEALRDYADQTDCLMSDGFMYLAIGIDDSERRDCFSTRQRVINLRKALSLPKQKQRAGAAP